MVNNNGDATSSSVSPSTDRSDQVKQTSAKPPLAMGIQALLASTHKPSNHQPPSVPFMNNPFLAKMQPTPLFNPALLQYNMMMMQMMQQQQQHMMNPFFASNPYMFSHPSAVPTGASAPPVSSSTLVNSPHSSVKHSPSVEETDDTTTTRGSPLDMTSTKKRKQCAPRHMTPDEKKTCMVEQKLNVKVET
jgi:hypothetical protein